jgi:hypothetical protein
MSIRRGYEQGPFLLPLPFMVLYFGLQWTRDGFRASALLSLDKAALQDREDELAEPRGDYATWEVCTALLLGALLLGALLYERFKVYISSASAQCCVLWCVYI